MSSFASARVRARSRMVQKPDLAENRRYSQTGFEDGILTLRGDFLCDVTWCYAPSAPPGPLLPSPLDFIRIGFFDHTGSGPPQPGTVLSLGRGLEKPSRL